MRSPFNVMFCLLAPLFAAGAFARLPHDRRYHSAEDLRTVRTTDATPRDMVRQMAESRKKAKVFMSATEVALIESYLQPDDVMLEWGSGRSTLWYSQFVGDYYSIEHNAEWFSAVTDMIRERNNVHYLSAPVATGYKGWAGGFSEGTAAQFENYVKSVDDLNVPAFDKVLIDGRARKVCAEYVLKYLHKDSIVFVHDYARRSSYHPTLEKYYTMMIQTFGKNTLAVFRPTEEALEMAAKGEILTEFEEQKSA